jgi:hypothetical protein
MQNSSSAAEVNAAQEIAYKLLHSDISELVSPEQIQQIADNVIVFPKRSCHLFNRQIAVSYAAAGVPIFPCDRNKKPLVKWRDESTTDPATIREWFRRWPDAVIGIDCGKAGFIVVDADRHAADKDGVAALAELEMANDVLPDHPVVRTRGNGQHRYFRNPLA